MALQIRRGLEADRSSITPLAGELIYVTDTGNLYVGNGSTAGGVLVSSNLADDTSPSLSGNLNLNGNDIVGTGNIDIDGTITATGNINLGDQSADNISIPGRVTTSLTPKLDSAVDIGSAALRWRNGYFAGLTVNGEIDATAINARLIADDSTVAYDPANGVFDGNLKGSVFGDDYTLIIDGQTNQIFGELTGNVTGNVNGNVIGTLTGDIKGSVYADDSSVIIDGVSGTISSGDLLIDDATITYTGIGQPITLKNNFATTVTTPVRIETASSGSFGGFPFVDINAIKGSIESPEIFAPGDLVSGLKFSASSPGQPDAIISAATARYAASANVTDSNPASILTLFTNPGGSGLNIFTFDEIGQITAPGPVTPGVYSDAAARDAAITSPVAGMVVFITDIAKHQGYNGSTWNDFY